MSIDWFTVVAQALNFLALVWLMKRFLYGPITDAIEAREKRIADELADADAKRAEARKESETFKRRNEAFDRERDGLLATAKEEVAAERGRLLEEARRAADTLRAKRAAALARERDGLNDEITRRTRTEVFAIARKALTDLSGASLEARMVGVFADRLRGLGGEEKGALVAALASSDHPVLVRTAFDLPDAQREATTGVIREVLGAEARVAFETAPDLVGGIELSANGRKVAWSIAEYLGSLLEHVDELLDAKVVPDAATGRNKEAEEAR